MFCRSSERSEDEEQNRKYREVKLMKRYIPDPQATRTDAAGNGYYRGADGKYYYGNIKNGYLKETNEERTKRLAREKAQQKQKQNPGQKPAALFIFHKLDIKTQSVEAMREINNNDDQKGMDNYGKDKKFCKDE